MAEEALPIVRGYQYSLRMAVTGGDNPAFPEGAKLRAQVREYAGAPRLLAELTFDNGGLRRVSNDSVDMVMSEAATRAIGNSSAVVEFSRTDVTPFAYLYIMLRIPVMKDQISAPVVVTVKPALAVALSTPPAFYGGLAGVLQGAGTAVATLSALAGSMLSGSALGGGSGVAILRSIVSAVLSGVATGAGSGSGSLAAKVSALLAGSAAGSGSASATLAVGSAGVAFPTGPELYNFKLAQFSKWRSGVSRVGAGSGRAKVVTIGESTTWGYGGGTGPSVEVGSKAASWPSKFADRLATLGIAANKEGVYASGGNIGLNPIAYHRNSYKPGFNAAASWGYAGTTMGGEIFVNTTDAGTFGYTPEVPVDRFEILDITNTGLGSMTYAVDGGATTTLDQNAALASRKTTVNAGAPGTHTLALNRVAGQAFVGGLRAWNSAVPAVDVLNVGRNSAKASDWTVASVAYSSLPVLTAMVADADLVFIGLQINDELANTSESTFKTEYQKLITAAKAGGASVVILSGNPIATSSASAATQAVFLQYLKDLALTNDLPLIDQYARYTDYASMNAQGLMFNTGHPNAAGYADLGAFIGTTLNACAKAA